MSRFTWELPHFLLSLENLWSHPAGPVFSRAHATSLEEAHKKIKAKFASGKIGFYDWVTDPADLGFGEMEATAKRLRQEFEGALCLGIGGSYLGPNAAMEALRSPEEKAKFPIQWVSNVDPGVVREAAFLSGRKKCATVVISKSGGTVETLSAFYHLSHKLDPKGYVIITDPKVGELRRLATANGWQSFPVPPAIGGRFSVLSAVGLFPALLGNISAREIFDGAAQMRAWLETKKPEENPAYHFALASCLWDTAHQHPLHYLMPYGTPIKLLSDWFVQLWAESLGKNGAGPTPVAAVGTSDQHSVLQLLKEGPNDKVVGFVEMDAGPNDLKIGAPRFETDAAFHFLFPHTFGAVTAKASAATEASLKNSGVPTYRLKLPRLTAHALGAFFFFFETACAAAGEFYGIDAFDQPGVEEAKKLLRQSL